MLILKEGEGCPFSENCPYNKNGQCLGATSDRDNKFTCDLVSEYGVFKEEGFRSPLDRTGRMRILMEDNV